MISVSDAQINAWLGLLLWPMFRILAMLSVDPFYSSRAIPIRVRVVLSALLALLIAPMLPAMPPVDVVSPLGILILIQQIMIGLAIGFTMRLVFSAVEMAGHIAGLQMGLGFAQFFDPAHGVNSAVVAQVASMLTILLFLALNGHLVVLETLVNSFAVLPISATPLKAAGYRLLVDSAAQVFTIAVLLSLPVLAALLITNLAIGVMSRAAPQLNLLAVGFPLTLSIGLGALYFTLSHFTPYVQKLIDNAARLSQKIAQMLA